MSVLTLAIQISMWVSRSIHFLPSGENIGLQTPRTDLRLSESRTTTVYLSIYTQAS